MLESLAKLFRLAGAKLTKMELDLSKMAREVLAELALAEPQRSPKVDIESGLIAYGDNTLLRIALQNLLGNAWKYTGKTCAGEIQFG